MHLTWRLNFLKNILALFIGACWEPLLYTLFLLAVRNWYSTTNTLSPFLTHWGNAQEKGEWGGESHGAGEKMSQHKCWASGECTSAHIMRHAGLWKRLEVQSNSKLKRRVAGEGVVPCYIYKTSFWPISRHRSRIVAILKCEHFKGIMNGIRPSHFDAYL